VASGTIVDAPSSTKNAAKARDPEAAESGGRQTSATVVSVRFATRSSSRKMADCHFERHRDWTISTNSSAALGRGSAAEACGPTT
jgi:hypothetical protein